VAARKPTSIWPRQGQQVLFAIVGPFQAFFQLEAAGGLVMIFNAALALVWANSPLVSIYEAIFHAPVRMTVGGLGIAGTAHHFTNDALLTLFFVVAGLEIKRELAHGELRTWNRAALPLVAAAGGMIVPALIYLAFNPSGPERAGWGIPMATDIAFALGCLALVRRRVPASVFVFLTALAIFDDLGAILVIALFYGGTIDPRYFALAVVITAALALLGRARVQAVWIYAVLGALLWAVVLRSGVHATVAGVIIGLTLPATPRREPREVLDDLDVAVTSLRRDCDRLGVAPDGTIAALERHLESVQSPLDRVMHGLHGVVAFGIVPLFALANAGVALQASSVWGSSVTAGVFFGLVVGKPLGVLGATWLALRLRLAPRPTNATWVQLVAASLMAGIGFTMSLFVGNLGLGHMRPLEDQAKLGVLGASLVSAVLGLLVLRKWSPALPPQTDEVPVVLDVPRFARGYGVLPLEASGVLVGRSLAELDVRKRFGVTVIGMWHGADTSEHRKLEPPMAEYQIADGDMLLVAGSDEAVESFFQFVRSATGG
jgi:NhaA family Na+:H+ antiporter